MRSIHLMVNALSSKLPPYHLGGWVGRLQGPAQDVKAAFRIGRDPGFKCYRSRRNGQRTTFDSFVVGFVEAHPEDHFLLIVDENLEVNMDGMNQNCVSGSVLV